MKSQGSFVRADKTLYYSTVQTMPFARPRIDELPTSIDLAITRHYPAHGDHTGPVLGHVAAAAAA